MVKSSLLFLVHLPGGGTCVLAPPLSKLIPVVIRLVWSGGIHPDVPGLLIRQTCQMRADTVQVQPGYFLVQVLGQHGDRLAVALGVLVQLDLGHHPVGERGAHHEAGVAGGAAGL